MRPKNTCNQKQMRTMNSTAVLCALASQGPTSRGKLSSELNLDGTTITHLVRGLLNEKLIKSHGFSMKTTGRPRELLQLNTNGREAVGLLLGPNKVVGAVVNLGGQVKFHETICISDGDSRNVLLRKIRMVCEQLLQKTYKNRLLGIGLSYHGIVNNDNVLEQSVGLSALEGINFSQFFGDTFNLPFAMQDTTRCMAIAEHWFGIAKNIEDFVLLELSFGVGCAIVINSKPFCGVTNSSGEIGHVVVVPNGKTCRCGMRGCLETVASLAAIEKIFAERFPDSGRVTYADIAQMVAQGHPGAIEIITEAGKYIGIALSHIVNVLNPSHLILCGELLRMGPILTGTIKSSLKFHTISSSYNALQIMNSQLESDSAVIGAATLILERTFSSLA